MHTRVIVLIGLLATANLLSSQPAPQIVTDGEGNKLTYSNGGILFSGKDGSQKQLPATWLNQNCSNTELKNSDDLAALKEFCENWNKFLESSADSESILDPPKVIPDNCSITDVVKVKTHGQSDAYYLLGFEIAALNAGHEAEGSNALASKSMKSESGSDPTEMLADVFQKFEIASDQYRCGAFMEGQYSPSGEARQTDRTTAISVYNRLAIINSRMKDYVESRFRMVGNQDTNSMLENANTLAKLTNDRKAAFSDLASATTLSAMLSIYTGDPSATVADTLDMNADERRRLLLQIDLLMNRGSPDGFTQMADILKTFLTKHPKVRN